MGDLAPNVVASPATRRLAARLLAHAREEDPATAAIRWLPHVSRTQGAALVVLLLEALVDAPVAQGTPLGATGAPSYPMTKADREAALAQTVAAAYAAHYDVHPSDVLSGKYGGNGGRASSPTVEARYGTWWALMELGVPSTSLGVIFDRHNSAICRAVRNLKRDPVNLPIVQAVLAGLAPEELTA